MVRARLASGSSRWLSQPCWLTSSCGPNDRRIGGTTAGKARGHPASPVPAGNATVTGAPARGGPAGLVRPPGAGEQRVRVLVHADGQDPRVVPEDGLHAVAVMGVH